MWQGRTSEEVRMFDYFYGQSGEMFSYFRVPKILFRDIKFKDLSTDAKTLYGILLDRMGLSVKNGWLDEQGRVYIIFPVQEVMDALGCADNKATKLFRELEKFGLIERKRRGLGKPNLIYVKNFADPRFRNREKNSSGAADSAQQETAKQRRNKTEWNKTEGSEPDPFSSDAEDELDERTRLEAYFMQSLEVDLLLRVCPDEEDTIHQIVNLLVDTCSSKRRMLRVAGDDKPADAFYSRLCRRMERQYQTDASEVQRECEKLEVRNQEIDDLFLNLYTDKAKGILSEQRFLKLTSAMEQEQEANRKRLQDLSLLIRRTESQESDIQTFIHEIRQYAAIQELDEAMLHRLISRIVVGEMKKVDGQKQQEVKIIYNFVGEIPE